MTAVALLGLVIVIEAFPVLAYLKTQWMGDSVTITPRMIGALALVVVICFATTVLALRTGLQRMEAMEF